MKNLSKFLKACLPQSSMPLTMLTFFASTVKCCVFIYGVATNYVNMTVFALYYIIVGALMAVLLLPVIYWSGTQADSFGRKPGITGKTSNILLRDEENITIGIIVTIAVILASWPLVCAYYLSMQLIMPRAFTKFSPSCVLVFEKQNDGNVLKGVFDDGILYLGYTAHLAGVVYYQKYFLPTNGTTTGGQLRQKLIEATKRGEDYLLIDKPFKVI